MPHIRDAALDFYRDREKQKSARAALREFRQKAGGCDCEDDETPRCYLMSKDRPIQGNEEYEPWFDTCQAAQPLWEAYRNAANLAGASLRKLLRLCRKAT